MEEVERQLKPFKETLDKNTRDTESINRWKLALWSNGSGGPPGYLEIAREQDKQWKDKLLQQVDELKQAQLLKTGAEEGHIRWMKKWATIVTIVIAFLALVVGLFTFFEGRRVSTGELKLFSHESLHQEYSSSRPFPQIADTP